MQIPRFPVSKNPGFQILKFVWFSGDQVLTFQIPRFGHSDIPRILDSEFRIFRESHIEWFPDLINQRIQNSRFQILKFSSSLFFGLEVSQVFTFSKSHIYRSPRVQKYKISDFRFSYSQIPRFSYYLLFRFSGSQIPRFPVCQIPWYPNSQIAGFQGSDNPKIPETASI